MHDNDSQLLHTIEQTRRLLACGRNTVYNLVKRNELTMIKMGRRSLITDDSIKEYIDRKVAEVQHLANPTQVVGRVNPHNVVASL